MDKRYNKLAMQLALADWIKANRPKVDDKRNTLVQLATMAQLATGHKHTKQHVSELMHTLGIARVSSKPAATATLEARVAKLEATVTNLYRELGVTPPAL
jgi:hypothetical protein